MAIRCSRWQIEHVAQRCSLTHCCNQFAQLLAIVFFDGECHEWLRSSVSDRTVNFAIVISFVHRRSVCLEFWCTRRCLFPLRGYFTCSISMCLLCRRCFVYLCHALRSTLLYKNYCSFMLCKSWLCCSRCVHVEGFVLCFVLRSLFGFVTASGCGLVCFA